MSLDVYLRGPERTFDCQCSDCGNVHSHRGRETLFEANITHNLARMAAEAGFYHCIWSPDEIGVTKAKELTEPLRAGLALLKSDRARFEAFNPANGWGDYDGFVAWVERYLDACEQHPEADVEVWR